MFRIRVRLVVVMSLSVCSVGKWEAICWKIKSQLEAIQTTGRQVLLHFTCTWVTSLELHKVKLHHMISDTSIKKCTWAMNVANANKAVRGDRDGAVVTVLAPHQCGQGSIPVRCHMWVHFVDGSRLAPRVFSGFFGFPSLLKFKNNLSKFEFDHDRGPSRLIFTLKKKMLVCPVKTILKNVPYTSCVRRL